MASRLSNRKRFSTFQQLTFHIIGNEKRKSEREEEEEEPHVLLRNENGRSTKNRKAKLNKNKCPLNSPASTENSGTHEKQ